MKTIYNRRKDTRRKKYKTDRSEIIKEISKEIFRTKMILQTSKDEELIPRTNPIPA